MSAPTLYYDGQCPLCKREIAMLRSLTHNKIRFEDIHTLNENTEVNKADLLRRLHCQKADGKWLVGLDANVHAWSHTKYGFLFKPLRYWPLRPIVDLIYEHWADKRYAKRYTCHQCNNQIDDSIDN